jgi:hypothetical protein
LDCRRQNQEDEEMIVKTWNLRIGGGENNYQVHVEMTGEAESIDQVRESLRGLLGNIRLTTAEVAADLEAGREFAAHSLPVVDDPALPAMRG